MRLTRFLRTLGRRLKWTVTRKRPAKAFSIDEAVFRSDFLPAYEHFDLDVRTVLQFGAQLPFQVPVPGGTPATTFFLGNGDACSILLHQVHSTHQFSAGAVSTHAKEIPLARTRVEFLYVTGKSPDEFTTSRALTDVFESCVELLNYIILGHAVVTHDESVFRVGRESFDFITVYRVIDHPNWDTARDHLFVLHDNAPFVKPDSDHAVWKNCLRVAVLLQHGWNPFVTSEELRLAGRRHLRAGMYRDAVIYAQMSVESFLRALYVGLRVIEGTTREDGEAEVEDLPFMGMVKREFGARIGGDWDVKEEESFIGKWFGKCYKLRNMVVHEAYAPSFEEVREASHWAYGFRGWVAQRVIEAPAPYNGLSTYLTTDPAKVPEGDPVRVWGKPPWETLS